MQALGFTTTVPGPIEAAKERVTKALAAEGFGVLTHIDVAATLASKVGAEIEPYEILGACNPRFAHAALEAFRGVGLLLPCNVVLRQVEGAIEVGIVRPEAMFAALPAEASGRLAGVMKDATAALERVVGSLGS